MKVTYLGTAAAEGMPAVFCNCAACNKARTLKGKNIRTRSQVLINDDLLVDFPMDTYFHALTFNIDLSAIKNVFISHAHMDHCYPQELCLHGEPYAHNMTTPILSVYGNKTVIDKIKVHTRYEMKESIVPTIRLHTLSPYAEVEKDGYRVIALPAKHTANEDCLIYAIEHEGKCALLFNDSGILDDRAYQTMATLGLKFDFVSFDCTYGNFKHGEGRHMGLLDNVQEREKMKQHGLTHENTTFVVTHFSHNGGLMHEEMERAAAKHNMRTAYDGLAIKI